MPIIRYISIIAIVGIVFLFIPDVFIKYNVYKSGELVNATIFKIQDNCNSKNNLATFSYKSKRFSKRVSSDFCNKYHVGDSIDMHYNKDIPNELEFTGTYHRYLMELISCVILIIIFVVLFLQSK